LAAIDWGSQQACETEGSEMMIFACGLVSGEARKALLCCPSRRSE
jgi:hypothetical protein